MARSLRRLIAAVLAVVAVFCVKRTAVAAERAGATPLAPASMRRAASRPVQELFIERRDRGVPQTRSARRLVEVLDEIRSRLKTTRYQHPTIVRERDGYYAWDCSGMAAWVLRRAAPAARSVLGWERRPVAASFYRAIDRAPTDRPRWGWQRLTHIEQARPGDVFAWLRPPDWPPRNTGHVGFVLERPRPLLKWPGAYLVRVADATSIPHQNDTRAWPGDGGFGVGTILFWTDGNGQATHYGWYGTRSRGLVETRVIFGRVYR